MAWSARLRRIGAVEAWIGYRVSIDPTRLTAVAGGPRTMAYEHPEAGKVTVSGETLCTKYALFPDAGFDGATFAAFQAGFEGKGKPPLWGKRRTCYTKGVEARTKWEGCTIEARD